MSWRARSHAAGTVIALVSTAGLLAGCSLSNTSTARSTPTPASDQPYPSLSPTATPTTTRAPTVTASPAPTPSPTPRPSPTPTPTPSPSPKPTTAAHVVYGYLDSIARTSDGYAVSYRAATRCDAAKAPVCRRKPDQLFADGSWLVKPAKTATRSALAPKAAGSVRVKGRTVELSPAALTPLPAPGGLVVDLRSAPVAVKITAAAAVTSITQLH
jgi:hypothetical protein